MKALPVTRAAVEHVELGELEIERPDGSPALGGKGARDPVPWIERARALGMQNKQLVWELHVVQGRHQLETARLLKISPTRVWQLYTECRRELTARAPVTEEDFVTLREELKVRLLATYEVACESNTPRWVGLRLRALDQLSKLHGLTMDRRPVKVEREVPYALPEEVAEQVREAVLDLHGRREDIEAARKALGKGPWKAGG
jgi:hypothetical protein